MLRKIASIGAGIIVATLIMLVLQWVGERVVPVPAQVDPARPEMERVPLPALIVMLVAWFLGTLAGGAVANRLSRLRWPCWVIAGLVICGTLYQFAVVSWSPWMTIGGIAAPLLAAWLVSLRVPRSG